MAHYTTNFNLYEKDPAVDGADLFSITSMMNENWDKLDMHAQKKLSTGSYIQIENDVISAVGLVPTSRTINGQMLTSDVTISAVPSQEGMAGKYLTTDGTNASWGTIASSANPSLGNLDSYGEAHFDNKYVNVTGDTMTGKLSISGISRAIDLTGHVSSSTANSYQDISCVNTSGQRVGVIRFQDTGTYNEITLCPIRRGTDTNVGGFSIRCDANGNISYPMPQITASYVNGTSGYIVYSNGLKIQWGQNYHTGGDQTYTITFLQAFSNGNYIPSGSWSVVSNVGDHALEWSITNRWSTGMTLSVETSGYNSQNCYIYWMVIGF